MQREDQKSDYNIRRGHKNPDKNRETAKMMIPRQSILLTFSSHNNVTIWKIMNNLMGGEAIAHEIIGPG